MKNLVLFLVLAFSLGHQALACSEPGPHDFDMDAKARSGCAKIALKYATQFANTMVKIEGTEKGYQGPKGGFKAGKAEPSLYTTRNRSGNSKLAGFNVGLDSKNGWQCNFCVDMSLDDKGLCRIESVLKHMCAR